MSAIKGNALGVRALARASSAVGATLVHYSTDFVFDGEGERPYSEGDAARPLGNYGLSKLLGEYFALEVPSAYVLRVESLFGGKRAKSSVDKILAGIRAGQPVRVFADRTVSPSYVDDVVDATDKLLVARHCARAVPLRERWQRNVARYCGGVDAVARSGSGHRAGQRQRRQAHRKAPALLCSRERQVADGVHRNAHVAGCPATLRPRDARRVVPSRFAGLPGPFLYVLPLASGASTTPSPVVLPWHACCLTRRDEQAPFSNHGRILSGGCPCAAVEQCRAHCGPVSTQLAALYRGAYATHRVRSGSQPAEHSIRGATKRRRQGHRRWGTPDAAVPRSVDDCPQCG